MTYKFEGDPNCIYCKDCNEKFDWRMSCASLNCMFYMRNNDREPGVE